MIAVILLTFALVFAAIAVLSGRDMCRQLGLGVSAHRMTAIFIISGLLACLTGFYGLMVWTLY